jgi:hypothetical protein
VFHRDSKEAANDFEGTHPQNISRDKYNQEHHNSTDESLKLSASILSEPPE